MLPSFSGDRMMEIKLLTRDGGYVVTAIIPPFQLMPEVLLWGERFFGKTDVPDQYREICCVAVVSIKEELEKFDDDGN